VLDYKKEIRKGLKRHNISISKLSRLADIHHATLYRFLDGTQSIMVSNLSKIMHVLEGMDKEAVRNSKKNS